jgi:hypothetical protein
MTVTCEFEMNSSSICGIRELERKEKEKTEEYDVIERQTLWSKPQEHKFTV